MDIAKGRNLHILVMMLCFIYGGISLLFFIVQITTLQMPPGVGPGFERQFNMSLNDTGLSDSFNITDGERPERIFISEPRIASLFYVIILISLSGSIISITAGASLYSMLRKKERKELKRSMIDIIATPEEKVVINALQENNGELTQSELVNRTRLSKVKVHRIVKRLEKRKVLEKHPYGLTNKIRLNGKLHEDER